MPLLIGEGLYLYGGGDPLGPAPGKAAPGVVATEEAASGVAHTCNPNEPAAPL
jgi:hypothetical protein